MSFEKNKQKDTSCIISHKKMTLHKKILIKTIKLFFSINSLGLVKERARDKCRAKGSTSLTQTARLRI